jgi:hypothetical protein
MSLWCTCLRAFALAAVLPCLAIPAVVSAESGVTAQESVASKSKSMRSNVSGVVWNADNSPYSNGKVRLRNVHSGRVEAAAVTTERGQFTFSQVPSGSYLAEVIDDAAKVIAVGQSFRVEPGETAATFVRLPARKSWLAGAFSNTAAAVIAAASSAGVTAIGSQAPPVSPQ